MSVVLGILLVVCLHKSLEANVCPLTFGSRNALAQFLATSCRMQLSFASHPPCCLFLLFRRVEIISPAFAWRDSTVRLDLLYLRHIYIPFLAALADWRYVELMNFQPVIRAGKPCHEVRIHSPPMNEELHSKPLRGVHIMSHTSHAGGKDR